MMDPKVKAEEYMEKHRIGELLQVNSSVLKSAWATKLVAPTKPLFMRVNRLS